MPAIKSILTNQNLADLVTSSYGTMEALFDVCLANEIEVTSDLIGGMALQFPSINVQNELKRTPIDLKVVIVEKGMVLPFQTLPDLSMQFSGELDVLFDISLLNNLSITDDLTAGEQLIKTPVKVEKVVRVFSGTNKPATGSYPLHGSVIRRGGIGYMQIQNDFKAS